MRPTGIPRVALEMALVAQDEAPEGCDVRFCAYDEALPGFAEVPLDELKERAGYSNSNSETLKAPTTKLGDMARAISKAMPGDYGRNINRFRALRQFLKTTKTRLQWQTRTSSEANPRAGLNADGGFYHPFSGGDTWINFGCWWHGRNPEALTEIKAAGCDITTCVLIHDCMPLIYPEYFPVENALDWSDGVGGLRASTDIYLGNSENTCADIREAILGDNGDGFVGAMRLGEDFHSEPVTPEDIEAARAQYGIDRPYVLYCSTIEVRKNHALAFRAWRQLLREQGEDIPLLVFVGNWGWKTRDLKEQFEDSNALAGHLKVLNGVPDKALAGLYAGAAFTIFPSLYEGWGLPVRESQLHGKVCLAAQNSAIVEAGGDLAVYFENDSREDFLRQLRRLLDDDSLLKAQEEKIAAEFEVTTWRASWSGVRAAIEGFAAQGQKGD